MQSSAYYLGKIHEYQGIQGQINGLVGAFGDSEGGIGNVNSDLENIIINGTAIDNGDIEECKSALDNAKGMLNAVVGECSTKIAENQALYQQALAYEEELRRRAEEARLAASRASGE